MAEHARPRVVPFVRRNCNKGLRAKQARCGHKAAARTGSQREEPRKRGTSSGGEADRPDPGFALGEATVAASMSQRSAAGWHRFNRWLTQRGADGR